MRRVLIGLYSITHTASRTVYFGQAQDISKRWGEHRRDLKHGRHSNPRLQRAWDKYGSDAFEFAVVQECAVADLNDAEQRLLDEYVGTPLCYNIARWARAPWRGMKHTAETRRRMSEVKRGKSLSDETRRRMSEVRRGRVPSEERMRKFSQSRAIPVAGLDPTTGTEVVRFASAADAGRNGYERSSVSACVQGKLKTHKGLRWVRAEQATAVVN